MANLNERGSRAWFIRALLWVSQNESVATRDQNTFATSPHLCYWCPALDLHPPVLSWVIGIACWLICLSGFHLWPECTYYVYEHFKSNFLIFIYNILFLILFCLVFDCLFIWQGFCIIFYKGTGKVIKSSSMVDGNFFLLLIGCIKLESSHAHLFAGCCAATRLLCL